MAVENAAKPAAPNNAALPPAETKTEATVKTVVTQELRDNE